MKRKRPLLRPTDSTLELVIALPLWSQGRPSRITPTSVIFLSLSLSLFQRGRGLCVCVCVCVCVCLSLFLRGRGLCVCECERESLSLPERARSHSRLMETFSQICTLRYRGTSLIRKHPPPRTAVGP